MGSSVKHSLYWIVHENIKMTQKAESMQQPYRVPVVLALFLLLVLTEGVQGELGQCVFGPRCECRRFDVGISSTDRPKSGLTGPFLAYASASYPHGEKCSDGPFPGPIKPGMDVKFQVGNPGESVYVGLSAMVEYNLFSDDGLVDLGCQLRIELLNPFWPTGGYERASLVGVGCTQPPLVGKPPSGSTQTNYGVQLETGQVQIDKDLSFVEYYIFYRKNVASNSESRFFWGDQGKTVVGPNEKVCKGGKLFWYPLDEQGFDNIEVLTSRFYVTAQEAGRKIWLDYDEAQCYPSGNIAVEDACFRFVQSAWGSGIMREYQYRGSVEYLCSSGENRRVLTSSGNMYSQYIN